MSEITYSYPEFNLEIGSTEVNFYSGNLICTYELALPESEDLFPAILESKINEIIELENSGEKIFIDPDTEELIVR